MEYHRPLRVVPLETAGLKVAFGANTFGSSYFGQGPVGIVVLVLFGHVFVATLVSTNAALTVDSTVAALSLTDGNAPLGLESTSAVLMLADGTNVFTVAFTG